MKMLLIAKVVIPFVALVAVGCNKTASASDAESAPASAAATDTKVVAISVGSDGFSPSSVHATKGQKLTLKFTRTTDGTCAKDVAFPELNIKKALPLNQPVTIEVPTTEARKLTFQCGMGMYKSSVVVH